MIWNDWKTHVPKTLYQVWLPKSGYVIRCIIGTWVVKYNPDGSQEEFIETNCKARELIPIEEFSHWMHLPLPPENHSFYDRDKTLDELTQGKD